jgi:PAS domain S-box-containing protein
MKKYTQKITPIEKQAGMQEEKDILFSSIVGLAHDAIVVVGEDQNIIMLNQGAERIFGYVASEAVGQPLDILIPSTVSDAHRKYVKKFAEMDEPARYMHQRREILGRRKNGETFPAEASIVKVSDGEQNVFAAILRDVSFRRDTDAWQVTFSHAIEQAGDIVFITNQKGIIEYVNPAFEKVTGYGREDVIGKTPRILKSGMMSDEYYQDVWKTILSGDIVRAEVLDRDKSGELFYYDQTISPLKDAQGCITHFISTGKDVTQRKRTEQEVHLLLRLTQAIAESESFDAALHATLKLVCETMNWDFGEVWIPVRDESHLEIGAPYYSRCENVERFRSASGDFKFTPGSGLPGRVWDLGQPIWIEDITAGTEFSRAAFAAEVGFKTAVGIPVMAGKKVVTILEFFMRKVRPEDMRMMVLSSAISTQLGTAFQRKHSEETLKQSEARLREAQRIAKMGNWELDLVKNQLIWSDEIFRIFEIDKNKFGESYDAFLNLIHPEDREAVNQAYNNSIRTREPYEIVHRLLIPDGRVKYVQEHGETFYAPDGAPVRLVGLVQDITERKLSEFQKEAALNALHENEQHLRMIFETMSEGIALNEIIYDENGEMVDYRVLEVNPAFYSTADYRGKNIIGKLATEVYGMSSEYIREFWRRHKDSNSTIYTEMRSPLGHRFFFVAASPFVNGRFVTSFFDITGRKLAEEALRASEEKFKTILNEAPLGIGLVDSLTGKFESVNPMYAEIIGRSVDELINLDWMTITHPDDIHLNLSKVNKMNSGQSNGFQMEKRYLRPDGSLVWVNLKDVPLKVKAVDHPIHLAMIEDITERKRAEEALRESEEKYRTVADFTYDWEAWRGPDGAYIYVSPACKRITGHAVEEFLADSDLVLKIAHPQDLSKIHHHREDVARNAHEATMLEYEFRIITPDGEARWINHTCLPVYGKSGEFLGRRENNREVTARKQIELELRDSQQRLREIIDVAPFGAHIYQIDEKGQLIFVDANQSANETLGVDNSAFIGKTLEKAFPHLVRTELPQMYRRAAIQGIQYNAPRFNYKDSRLSAIFEIHAIQIAAGRVAVFFRNISDIEAAYDATIVGWSRAMDLRDQETEAHTERVTNMTVDLARAMGLTETELIYVRWGALLHDMGKIGIPDEILRKPGKLTDEEWSIMRRHPEFAYDMLNPIHFLRPALDIPYCHHEHWDGTGYPRGLKGVQIPLSARIFSLVDAWDALRSDRPYRASWTAERTIAHIDSLTGTHFDPVITQVFLDFVRQNTK